MAKNNKNKTRFQNGNSPGGIKKRVGRVAMKKGMGDARQKIIQKKRKTVLDARDILSGGKVQDARSKLVKMRERSNGNVKAIGKNILRKTDRNGKISLVTNKNRTPNNINLKIQQQLGLVSAHRNNVPKHVKKVMNKRPGRIEMERMEPAILKKTIRNEYSPPPIPAYAFEHPADMYRWYPGVSPLLAPMEPRRPVMDITVSRGSLSDNTSGNWRTFSSQMRQANSGFVDLDATEDEEMAMVSPVRPGMTRIPSNIHSRLDTNPMGNPSHGILSQTKTKVIVPMGHRIVVSNLQATVTQDDIRELFEDIGQLLVAKLVRPGTAEVIYKNLKDAQKAVDTYHNRQLDGQPMKCLLVNKRPINNPTAPAIKATDSLSIRKLPPVSASNKLVPDISTIHKVLFQRN